MGTVNLSPSTLSPARPAGVRQGPAPSPAAPVTAEDSIQAVFDGLNWTHCPGAEGLLTAVPARAWADPGAQGWQRVKHNARREVWRATIQGAHFYLKYYFADVWLRMARRLFRVPACRAEWEGGLFARRAGIAAVRPVAYTMNLRRGTQTCALLVTEAIEPAQPLSDFWLQLGSDEDGARRRHDTAQLIDLLAELIARAHQAGFEHLDMHAANILVQPLRPRRYRAVLVDLHSARRGVPLGDHAVVRNLAQLNQWFRRHSSVGDRLRFLRAYLRWRNEFESLFEHGRPLGLTFTQLVAALQRGARRHAWRLWAQRDRRVARDGRYFSRIRLSGGWRGMAVASCKHATEESRASRLEFDPAWWRQQLEQPLRWFGEESSQSYKASHSALVRRALLEHENDTLPVIIKQPQGRNWKRRFAQLWPPSRSRRGWRMGHALLHRDVPTARPLAVLERRFGPLVLDSLLVTEAIPGALDLETLLRNESAVRTPADWARLKRTLCNLLARQLRRLHERGFEHRDCKASNILVIRYPELKLLWIDLDGLRQRAPLSLARQLRPLVRLHVSLLDVPGLTRTDRVRFLKAYFARYGSPPHAWREVWPTLERASVKKRRAKEVQRVWKLKHYGRE